MHSDPSVLPPPAVSVIQDLLKVLHPGVLGLIQRHHGNAALERASSAVLAARTFLAQPDGQQPFNGCLTLDGAHIDFQFTAPTNAPQALVDAAFLAGLAQHAHIGIEPVPF